MKTPTCNCCGITLNEAQVYKRGRSWTCFSCDYPENWAPKKQARYIDDNGFYQERKTG